MESLEVTLPGGLALDGEWVRTASLRPVAGHDEVFLFERAAWLPPAQRVTALLARCLASLGPVTPVTSDLVRSLRVGDREALLLHLRRLTLGERMSCVVTCPEPACRQLMDIDLMVSTLLVAPYKDENDVHECEVEDGGRHYRVRFRLPTGADQETATGLAAADPQGAALLVLERCIKELELQDHHDEPVTTIPPGVARAVSELMAAADPQAELVLDACCSTCGSRFSAPFDTAEFFFRELAHQRPEVFDHVHLLASRYHWTEGEILAMPRQRRHFYLGLLAEAQGAAR